MNNYSNARALRTFEHFGETFVVVRWRNDQGKHWRGYTAVLHEGVCVASDISRNKSDAEMPWEQDFARLLTSRESLMAGIQHVKSIGGAL